MFCYRRDLDRIDPYRVESSNKNLRRGVYGMQDVLEERFSRRKAEKDIATQFPVQSPGS